MPARRRSPLYVRQFADKALHSLVSRLNRERVGEDLSAHQEWLYDSCISELEYRWRRTRPVWKRCACMYCVPPFPAYDLEVSDAGDP